jgi:hypothetical protein
MRPFIGFLAVFTLIFCVEKVHPQCSMTNMIGVEWLECLTNIDLHSSLPEGKNILYKRAAPSPETVRSLCSLAPEQRTDVRSTGRRIRPLKADVVGSGTDEESCP